MRHDKQHRPRPPQQRRGTIAIRMSDAERRIIEAAASAQPQYVTTYIREAALEAARRDLLAAPGSDV